MSNLDVALRLRLERSGFQEGKRDIDELKRSAAALGAGPGVDRLASPLREVEGAAKRTRDEFGKLAAEEGRLGRSAGAATLERNLAQVGAVARSDTAAIEKVRLAADGLGTSVGARKLGDDLQRITANARGLDKEVGDVRRSMERLGRENGVSAVARDFRDATTAAEAFERRVRSAGNTVGAMRGPNEGARSFAREALQESGATRFLPIAGGLGVAGMAGVAAGAAVYGAGAVGASSVRRAMATQSSMADVERALNDPTQAQLRAIEEGVAKLSRRDGIAAGDYYSFITEAAKSGIAQEDLLQFAGFGQRFALAADMTGAEAGEVLAKNRANYGLDLRGAIRNADAVNYLADNDAAKERNIVQFMREASGNARIAALSADQMATYGTVFDSLGVSPSEAGTGMNALISRLGTASSRARTDEGFRRSLGRLGLSGNKLQSDFFEDGNATVLDLLGRVSQMPRERQLETLRGLGGDDHGDTFALLVTALERLVETQERLSDPKREGSVDRTFEITMGTVAHETRVASAALADLGSEIGKNLLPAVKAVSEFVARVAGGWADSMRRSDATDELIGRIRKGGELTPEDRTALENGAVTGSLVEEEIDNRRRRLAREADERLRMTDEPDERRAGEVERTERTKVDIERQIEELRTALKIMGPEQAGHANGTRMLDVLEKRLIDINETLKGLQTGGTVDPVAYGNAAGEARLYRASLRRQGQNAFESDYAGGAPVMDGYHNTGRSPGRGGGGGVGRVTPDAAAAVGAGAGAGSLRTTKNPGGAAGELYDVWSTAFPDHQALALLGHAEKESSFNPQAWNADEGASGILQWRGERLDNLKAFAASKGMNWQDRKVQAAFVDHEMKTDPYERQRSERFRNARTLEEASAGLEDYIRFGDGSGAERLGNARRHADAFGAEARAGAQFGAGGPMAAVSYANRGATRNKPVTPELMAEIQRGISAVYGDGYRGEIYSGGQDAKGTGGRRTGSTRHDDQGRGGMAADLYVYDPNGKRLSGEALGRLGQHWLATGQGGVGMEMRGGGIHLDQHKDRHPEWDYGGYRPGQAEQVRRGLAGIPPAYANPAALDPAAMATAGERHELPEPTARTAVPTRRPDREAPADASRSSQARQSGPVTVTQNFRGGFDAKAVAQRAQREQARSIRMAEARALHDTMVPIS